MFKTGLKKTIRKIHMVIGLFVGLLFFIISLSGAILAWKPEFSTLLYSQSITSQNIPFAPVSQLKATLNEEFPEGDFRGVFFQGRNRTANVLLYAPGTYYYAFMDPYSAEIRHLQNMKTGWLNKLVPLHRNLLMGDVGRHVVHWITLLALIMIITGIVLWWPSRKSRRKYCFTIPWKALPLKLNYDLHNVLGFYASWIGLFTILTGIFWGFAPVRDALKALTGEDQVVYTALQSDISKGSENHNLEYLIDSLAYAYQQKSNGLPFNISYPHGDKETINISLVDSWERVHKTDHLHFDQYTGERLKGHFENGLSTNASIFKTLNALVYDIHLGNFLGFVGRLLASLTALVLASLPITGFIIWWSKRQT